MNRYALDTNIISNILRKNQQLQERVYKQDNNGAGVIIPAVVYYEVKRGLLDCGATVKLESFKILCNALGIDEIDSQTLDKAADIYVTLKQSGKLIDDADILIAASCIVHGYTLVTDNTRHFERIDGLKFENWLRE